METLEKKKFIPYGFKVEKKNGFSVMTGGKSIFGGATDQVFIECGKCNDSIALTPKAIDRNSAVDRLSDLSAMRCFHSHGWLISGYLNSKITRCPQCKLK